MDGALYIPDGTAFVPSPLTVGPWQPSTQHGGPVAALLVRTVEREPSPGPVEILRITVELLRPAPLARLRVDSHVSRAGRNVQLVEVTLTAGDTEIARARALRLRVLDLPVPEAAHDPAPPPIPPTSSGRHPDLPAGGFLDAVDLRFVQGSWEEGGPALLWGRLVVPVVAGEVTSRLQQLAAVADFGNGVSRIVDFSTHIFINPDLTIALSRPPSGEWIGLDAVTRLSQHGFGQAESRLFDAGGTVGRAVQTLLVSNR